MVRSNGCQIAVWEMHVDVRVCHRYSNDKETWTRANYLNEVSHARKVFHLAEVVVARYFRLASSSGTALISSSEFQLMCGVPMVETFGSVECFSDLCHVKYDFQEPTILEQRGSVKGSRVTMHAGTVAIIGTVDTSLRGYVDEVTLCRAGTCCADCHLLVCFIGMPQSLDPAHHLKLRRMCAPHTRAVLVLVLVAMVAALHTLSASAAARSSSLNRGHAEAGRTAALHTQKTLGPVVVRRTHMMLPTSSPAEAAQVAAPSNCKVLTWSTSLTAQHCTPREGVAVLDHLV